MKVSIPCLKAGFSIFNSSLGRNKDISSLLLSSTLQEYLPLLTPYSHLNSTLALKFPTPLALTLPSLIASLWLLQSNRLHHDYIKYGTIRSRGFCLQHYSHVHLCHPFSTTPKYTPHHNCSHCAYQNHSH